MPIIQNAVFPSSSEQSDVALYFRLSHGCMVCTDGEVEWIAMSQGSSVGTDTYFNGFSIGKWKNHAGLSNLSLSVSVRGAVRLTWFWYCSQKMPVSLGEVVVSSDDPAATAQIAAPECTQMSEGILAFSIEALEDSELHGFEYGTSSLPRREVRLAMVITHFNRQQFLIPAVRRLCHVLLSDSSVRERVALYVIDNSQNLNPADIPDAVVVPNANLGGSGGFTRGLMHVQDSGLYTHCLFMDDDASCEVESVRRTLAFLQHVCDEHTAMAGAMLLEQQPYVQYENGAFFNGVCHPRNSGFDLRDIEALLANEFEGTIDYGGWWFFAFPLSAVERYAFPFFVRGDDSFFSLSNPFSIVTLNGVGSWQGSFAAKDSPYVVYLDTRYHLVHNLLGLFAQASRGKAMRLMRSWFKRYALSYHYESAHAMLEAIEDVMQGPNFWRDNVDMVSRRQQLMSNIHDEVMRPLPESWRAQFDWVEAGQQKKSLLSRLTLNGHLIPRRMLGLYNRATSKGFGGGVSQAFGCAQLLCVDLEAQKGYVVTHDKHRFFAQLWRYYCVRYRFWVQYSRLQSRYRASAGELSSRDFWQMQFNKYQ